MSNSLINEKSPYLRAHGENPVDWYPWGREAFEKAKREDKPIFLSIGYSTCHWCHVMAEESFQDRETAEILNRHYVSVKVDREERPDVDGVYMEVCTALTGSGGWPLTIVMSPEGKPFFADTYLPRENRGGRLGLIPLLKALAEKWALDRGALLKAGEEISAHINRPEPTGSAQADEGFLKRAVEQLYASYDRDYGGFGRAPKFPAAHDLLFLLRYSSLSGDKQARKIAEHSLQQMYRGGIFDHIGGGFARYSTDREWLVPHFEKTLYDNALLAYTYAEAWQDGRLPLYRQVAESVLDYCLRELRSPEGGFYCGQDADSGGREGAYYLLTPAEVKAQLGNEDGGHFCECYDISEEGNFQGGSIPNLLLNQRWRLLPEGYEQLREKLRLYRAARLPLATDKKQLSSWNGLMLMALAKAARAFDSSRYLSAALALKDFILKKDGDGDFTACRIDGENRVPAQLDDYAFCALGLWELSQVCFEGEIYLAMERFGEKIRELFRDERGGYFRTAAGAEKLIKRPKELFDGAMPSGNSAAALLFDLLWRMTGKSRWQEARQEQLSYICRRAEDYPAGCAFGSCALLSQVYPTKELLCAAQEPPETLDRLMSKYAPELCLLVKTPENEKSLESFAPFTKGFSPEGEKPRFCLCQNAACGLPFTLD